MTHDWIDPTIDRTTVLTSMPKRVAMAIHFHFPYRYRHHQKRPSVSAYPDVNLSMMRHVHVSLSQLLWHHSSANAVTVGSQYREQVWYPSHPYPERMASYERMDVCCKKTTR